MTSKEALERKKWTKVDWLIDAYDNSKDKDPEWSGPAWDLYRDRKAKIEKDLEVLEILKKYSTKLDEEEWNSNIFNGIDYEELNYEEMKKIKEWLEK